jgi:hypothetical protein
VFLIVFSWSVVKKVLNIVQWLFCIFNLISCLFIDYTNRALIN